MKRSRFWLALVVPIAAATWLLGAADSKPAPVPVPAEAPQDGKLRIIAFGAHPDDCELREGGVAAKWATMGHKVKFVSLTNGDIGHWNMAGGPLAQRRTAEVQRCAKILGIETQVLDIHDGELMVTLELRKTICRLIREWNADIVISHRPNDYHPDHRYTGVLVMDAAYMVTVPFFCPDTPYLTKNPLFLFSEDRFRKPNPFTPDITVSIDDVIEKKMATVAALESQFYEGGCCSGGAKNVPDPNDAAGVEKRKRYVDGRFRSRFEATANRFRISLARRYGKEGGNRVEYAEAFEICEYGMQPSEDQIRRLFPFFPAR